MDTIVRLVQDHIAKIDPEAPARNREAVAQLKASLPYDTQRVLEARSEARASPATLEKLKGLIEPLSPQTAGGTSAPSAAASALMQHPELAAAIRSASRCLSAGAGGGSLSNVLQSGLGALPPNVQAAMQVAQQLAGEVAKMVALVRPPSPPPSGSGFVVEGKEVACVADMTVEGPLTPGTGCNTVLYNGRPVWRVGLDIFKCPVPVHLPGYVQSGAKRTVIGGQLVARKTDKVEEGTPPRQIIKGLTPLSERLPSVSQILMDTAIP